jgi:hypothetical protein
MHGGDGKCVQNFGLSLTGKEVTQKMWVWMGG